MSFAARKALLSTLASGIALAAHAAPANAAPADDAAAWLFDPNTVHEIELSIPPGGRAALAEEPDEYVAGTITIHEGETQHGPRPLGVRLKGNASFRPLTEKAAFKLKFNEFGGSKFEGLKRLTLNNMVQDPSNVREVLGFELFDAAGVPAPRAGYAYLTVDGENFGLYANVETLDDVALDKRYESTGHLYEGEYGADVVTGELHELQIEEGDEEDIADLEALAAALEAPDPPYSERMAPVTDLDELTRMWATEKYIGQWDGYASRMPGTGPGEDQPNNYFLHSDESGVFTMLPWGLDLSMRYRPDFLEAGGRLWDGCTAETQCREQFAAAVIELPALVEELDLRQRATDLATMLAPYQARPVDPARREYTGAEVAANVNEVRNFLAARPADVTDPTYWDGFPPPWPEPKPEPRPNSDTESPETTIDRAPDGPIETKSERKRVTIAFSASETNATFECRRNGREWGSCESPRRMRVGHGRHSIRVRAIDAAGNVDPTPAYASWVVRSSRSESGRGRR